MATTPRENDVLFGRGATISSHPGNARLRCLVQESKGKFVAAKKKKEKRQIARDIIAEIRGSDPPGRFLIEDATAVEGGGADGNGRVGANDRKKAAAISERSWVVVEDMERVEAKVMHSLREKEKASTAAQGSDGIVGLQEMVEDHSPAPLPVVADSAADGGGAVSAVLREQPWHQQLTSAIIANNLLQSAAAQANDSVGVGRLLAMQQEQPAMQMQHLGATLQGVVGQLAPDQQQQLLIQQLGKIANTIQQTSSPTRQPAQRAISDRRQQTPPEQQQKGSADGAAHQGVVGQLAPDQQQQQLLIQQLGTIANTIQQTSSPTRQPAQCTISDRQQQIPSKQQQGSADDDDIEQLISQISGIQRQLDGWENAFVPQGSQQQTMIHQQGSQPENICNQTFGSQLVPGGSTEGLSPGALDADDRSHSSTGSCFSAFDAADLGGETNGADRVPGLGAEQKINHDDWDTFLQNLCAGGNDAAAALDSEHLAAKATHNCFGLGSDGSPLDLPTSIDQQWGEKDGAVQMLPFDESLQAMGLDSKLGSFSGKCFSSHDAVSQRSDSAMEMARDDVHELSLREWIERSRPAHGQSSKDMAEYAKSALAVASRLTAFLIEAGRDEVNGVPLSSIDAENVLIRTKRPADRFSGADSQPEHVECARVTSCFGDDPLVGNVTARLYALGVVLFELFTAERPSLGDGASPIDAANLGSINLNDIFGNSDQRSQKTQRRAGPSSNDMVAGCMARMEAKGLPRSVRDLVQNLLVCAGGDFRGDDSYSSFADLLLDLQLMMSDPPRFLDDIQTNPMPVLKLGEKCYGREPEISKLNQAYQKHVNGECSGVLISGGAGVGKSLLAVHGLHDVLSNGYFLRAKFEQNMPHLKPLSTIGNMFNSLCESLLRYVSQTQLVAIGNELENALGSQAGALLALVPGLAKLLPPSVEAATFNDCVDSLLSMRYMLGEALNVLSSHSPPIVLLFDDIQWADSTSLLIIGNLVYSVAGKPVFFAMCVRDEELGTSTSLKAWLESLVMLNVETIKVEALNVEAINTLLSETLHLTPRITRPLASAINHKTAGNPLFLHRLVGSLTEQNCIYFQMNPPRWVWDLTKIQNMSISDDVVALLTKEMQKLKSDMRVALTAASCIGSSVNYAVLDILSKDLKVDLANATKRVSQKGFMVNDVEGSRFNFSHDKIQQSAYQLIPEEQRRERHMRYGLALCSHCLDMSPDNDEMLFSAVNQVNHGGPGVISDMRQKQILASLNLQAGRRAIDLSDYTSAFEFFRNGILFMPNNHWQTDYSLSLNLFDEAAESSCALNKLDDVKAYTGEVIANATCLDDKMNSLYCALRALRHAQLLQQCIDSTLEILVDIGEEIPRAVGDEKLSNRMSAMNNILQNITDDSILGMHDVSSKKVDTLQKIYWNLAHVLRFKKPSLMCDVSLRMVELTIQTGLCSLSALGFAYYGEIVTANGHFGDGCRLGRLALKLCERKNSSRYKANCILIVNQFILWTATPLQSIVDSHLLGQKCGRQSGDLFFATLNWNVSIATSYVAGFNFDIVRKSVQAYISQIENKKAPLMVFAHLLNIQTTVLKEGLQVADQSSVNGCPGEQEVLAKPENSGIAVTLTNKIHRLVRAFLFRRCDAMATEANVTDIIAEQKHSLRVLYLMGIFFEGLASFHLAREANETKKWIELTQRGEAALAKVTVWSQHSSWNWEHKRLLLEAENMQVTGSLDRAGASYIEAIQLAHRHKFIHDEAIASELAGMFHYRRGDREKSLQLLLHSVKSHETWGAHAVAKRVENLIASMFRSNCASLTRGVGSGLANFPGSGTAEPSKKRQDME